MEINGKVYRNLEGQVEYLTGKVGDLKQEIDDIKGRIIHYVVVDELPTEDIDPTAVYLVGPKGTAPNTYYEEWIYAEVSSGSYSWEKLGDTASIDLSGYLEKNTYTSIATQVYGKTALGAQTMINATTSRTASAIPVRDSNAQVWVPDTPTSDEHATSKKYVDGFVKKDTSTSTYRKAYVKKADGTGTDMIAVTGATEVGAIPVYVGQGQLNTADPTNDSQAVNRGYANSTYVAKETGTTSYHHVYCKNPDGTQGVLNAYQSPLQGALPMYRSSGTLRVGTPSNDADAATKKYVDDAVGQLLYLHDIELLFEVDASNYLLVRAYLINTSNTALTSLSKSQYSRLNVAYGAYGPSFSSTYDNEPCAVTKLPYGFTHDNLDEGNIGFLYQYESGGALLYGITDNSMTMTVTDYVTTF